MDTLLANLNSLDLYIKPVSDEEFSKTITTFLNSDSLRNEISGIITDLDKNKLPIEVKRNLFIRIIDYIKNILKK